jgi:hypothetical protein
MSRSPPSPSRRKTKEAGDDRGDKWERVSRWRKRKAKQGNPSGWLDNTLPNYYQSGGGKTRGERGGKVKGKRRRTEGFSFESRRGGGGGVCVW